MDKIFSDVHEFEEKLSLPKNFYENLLKEDDWSFIIKISTLFEAACTHALATKLAAPEIEDCLSFLEQANSKYGKIVLLKKLGVLYPEQAKFLENLASQRNKLSHDISNVSFTFEKQINSMDSNQKKSFVKWVGHGIIPEAKKDDVTILRYDFVLDNPKESMWLTAAEVLACMYLEIEHSELIQNSGIYKWLKT